MYIFRHNKRSITESYFSDSVNKNKNNTLLAKLLK
jgi:hypothetical protein